MAVLELKSPTANFEAIIRILRFSASICGIDLLRDNYRMNWITYTLFISISGYYGFVFFTIWKNYQDDWTILLRATVTLGTAFQGVSKLFTFISNKDVIFDMHKMLHDIYKDYEKRGDRYVAALHHSLHKTRKGMLFLTLLYVIGYFGVVTMPYVWLLTNGVRFLVIEFHVPGLDLETDMGYMGTIGFQTILVICYAFGLYCGDLVALVYLLQSFMFSYIFAAKVESLNEILADPRNRGKSRVTNDLKDIVMWHQLFSDQSLALEDFQMAKQLIFRWENRCFGEKVFETRGPDCNVNKNLITSHFSFTEKCNHLFYYVITVQIITAFCSTVLSIFLIMTGAWPGAYTYVIVSICSLYLYCILGTENEMAIEQFQHDVYNIHWYNMTVPQQKIVLQVLFKTQHPNTIDVAGVMPLSVTTALQLTKTVYSIAMAMIQFLIE